MSLTESVAGLVLSVLEITSSRAILAFQLTKRKDRARYAVSGHPMWDTVIPEGYGATKE